MITDCMCLLYINLLFSVNKDLYIVNTCSVAADLRFVRVHFYELGGTGTLLPIIRGT